MDDQTKRALVTAGIPAFAGGGVAANLMVSNAVPLTKLEPLLVLALTGTMFALLGPIIHKCAMPFKTFLLALLVLVYGDVAFGGNLVISWLTGFAAEWPLGLFKSLRIAVLLGAFGAIYASLWVLRDHAAAILLTFFTVAFAMTLAAPLTQSMADRREPRLVPASTSTPVRSPNESTGVFIHLVLDEFMAPGAIPDDVGEAAALRTRLYRFFEDFGFVVWDRAYSRHFMSGYSIPDMLNYQVSFTNIDVDADNYVGNAVPLENAEPYFESLASQGYRINVVQTAHLDFCTSEFVASCRSLESFNPFSKHIGEMGSVKFFMLLRILHKAFLSVPNSYFVNYIANYVVKIEISHDQIPLWLDGYAFPRWFDDIMATIIDADDAEAYFVHLLVPHAPYVLNASCEYAGDVELPYNLGAPYDYEDRSRSTATRAMQYRRYFGQSLCVVDKLEQLMSGLGDAGKLDQATVVINGDHGSRISESLYVDHLNEDDLADKYASLFAAKSPGVAPRIDHRFASIQDLFAEFMGFGVPEPMTEAFVIGRYLGGEFVRMEMPEF